MPSPAVIALALHLLVPSVNGQWQQWAGGWGGQWQQPSQSSQGGNYQQYMNKYGGDYQKYMSQGQHGQETSQHGDYHQYEKKYGGDYQKYMSQGQHHQGGDYHQYMKNYSGDYKKYMSQGKHGQGGDYQKYMKTYGGDYQKYMNQSQQHKGGDYHQYLDKYAGDYQKYMKHGKPSQEDDSQPLKQHAGEEQKDTTQQQSTQVANSTIKAGDYQSAMKAYKEDFERVVGSDAGKGTPSLQKVGFGNIVGAATKSDDLAVAHPKQYTPDSKPAEATLEVQNIKAERESPASLAEHVSTQTLNMGFVLVFASLAVIVSALVVGNRRRTAVSTKPEAETLDAPAGYVAPYLPLAEEP